MDQLEHLNIIKRIKVNLKDIGYYLNFFQITIWFHLVFILSIVFL